MNIAQKKRFFVLKIVFWTYFFAWGEIFFGKKWIFSPHILIFYPVFRHFAYCGRLKYHIFCQSKRTWYFCIANKKNRIDGKQK